jgi:periplasmic protein CpxP/Spy
MKYSPKQLIAALMLAGLGLAAVAQTPPGPPPGGPGRPGMERMERHDPARMQQFMQQRRAQRMARLKDTLQIVPAQEGAWTAWTAAMQPPANWKRPDRAEFERLATPERIDRMRALRTERNAMMDRRADATKAFYAVLNPIQKRVFDLETARRGKGGRGGQEGGRGGHHGWGR